ncbi:DUF1753-domain-containing protein [Coniophora puteana RWD-64-598 SS2]|uniref:DUF1753-domain-containing protein n=1 Tax=Coniophora puteana (strain RWD-64-598) TaxID=741705 RepID=A0A5M3MIV1_CONPW|nr:DUF1753-domain-containing protein [Coniophora puteana RWD-64-598 SS2]EIW79043.1 DUF1753-domain-containing protein [Coniophora puteana RWD-64-598 SS2]
MLRPEWRRLWPFSSFLALLDLKTGVILALLFALLNKVAGVYGLISVLTGAGGSFAQLTLYLYSTIALVALAWGLNAVREENAIHTLYFAHLYFVDHVLSTAWTVFFAVGWWVHTPHDGRRTANSQAQEDIRAGAPAAAHNLNLTDAQRAAAANVLWHEEKGTAALVIVVSWVVKIYFAALLYSYAAHLRKGSWASISRFRSPYAPTAHPAGYDPAMTAPPDEDEDEDDSLEFYRPSSGAQFAKANGNGNANANGNARPGHVARGSRGSVSKIVPVPSGSGAGAGAGARGGEVMFDAGDD